MHNAYINNIWKLKEPRN